MEIIPCTQATFLISKREEQMLTLREKFQLYVHLIVCEFCRRFLKQTKVITMAVRKLESLEGLSEDEKLKMQELLNLS
ncbi:MAG: hypothetical protein WAO19_04395 [Candidatus Kryptoniota bacterium]